MLVKVYFFGKGPGQGQISGLICHGPKIPDHTIVKQQTYVENFSSLGAIAAEKCETDTHTRGRHNDFSRTHFLKMCSNKKGKYWFHPKNFDNFFCSNHVFYR
jgi:hypothetical protein